VTLKPTRPTDPARIADVAPGHPLSCLSKDHEPMAPSLNTSSSAAVASAYAAGFAAEHPDWANLARAQAEHVARLHPLHPEKALSDLVAALKEVTGEKTIPLARQFQRLGYDETDAAKLAEDSRHAEGASDPTALARAVHHRVELDQAARRLAARQEEQAGDILRALSAIPRDLWPDGVLPSRQMAAAMTDAWHADQGQMVRNVATRFRIEMSLAHRHAVDPTTVAREMGRRIAPGPGSAAVASAKEKLLAGSPDRYARF
jgi:hypothetical protein